MHLTKSRSVNLNPRDVDLLYFLWKWKVSTTAALWRGIFPTLAPSSAYRRLWELCHVGFIECHSDRSARCFLWTLGRLGFERAQRALPEMREEGFRSEHLGHDLVVSALQLGDFLHGIPEKVGLFTEQEMRRLSHDFYPAWVPKSDLHRADGYWYVPVGNPMATVALEVELSPKKDFRHEAVASFYANEPQLVRVIWLVRTPALGRRIHEKILKGLRGRPMIHDFLSYPQFVKLGWDAPIEIGPETGRALANLAGNLAQRSDHSKPSKPSPEER